MARQKLRAKEKQQKINKRNNTEYSALIPHLNLKTRFELVDYDYVGKLSPKQKEWLNNFTEEYVHANMKHKGKKLHTTKKMKKDCYDRNNSRNRCILTRNKACGKAISINDVNSQDNERNNPEDYLIGKLDYYKKNGRDDEN
jgi:hypothetical protein